MKDLFSGVSGQYQSFRPTYPPELFDYLFGLVENKDQAWDCGTGNGQVAIQLARQFRKVHATDISKQQLEQAPSHPNIVYSIQQAGAPSFPDSTFDLITVAQAIHWFDIELFYREVDRTLKDGGIFSVIGYGLIKTFSEADKIINRFYRKIVGPYWDQERKYLDEAYQTLPFPFEEIGTPEFSSSFHWDFKHLVGYLGTWSAVQHYRDLTGEDPLEVVWDELKTCWGPKKRTVTFPLFTRIAKINK